jgi:predicted DNA-binding protein
VDLFYNLLKRKERKLKYQGRSEQRRALVIRLPVELKERLGIASEQKGISQSRLAVELISLGLSKAESVQVMPQSIEQVDTDDSADIADWLKRLD